MCNALEAKYRRAEKREARAEDWQTEDAEIVLVGYGIVGRILKAVTAELAPKASKSGCCGPSRSIRSRSRISSVSRTRAQCFVVVEMSNGQMVEDVRLALNGSRPVEFFSRMGGNVPSHEEVLEFVLAQAQNCVDASHRSRWPMSKRWNPNTK